MAQEHLKRAVALERTGNETCVDAYFVACRAAWPSMVYEPIDRRSSSTWNCYNDSLARLLDSASRFNRIDASGDLTIYDENQRLTVPTIRHGFAWSAADFQRFSAPTVGHEPLLQRRYGCLGVGVPLVIERRRSDCDPMEARFYPEKSPFAATAVLRFDAASSSVPDEHDPSCCSATLELLNPLHYRRLPVENEMLPLAVDLTAPLAWNLEGTPRSYLAGFISPGAATTAARLNFVEPYQRGKIPVVIIHGLFSDPQSWADLLNDLRAAPHFADRFQIWVFRYPTGQGFLRSAAALRTELCAAIAALDPAREDEALRNVVLIGHSMGGLIAKLQVAHSDELVWNQLANLPLEEIVTTESTRAFLAENCYFDPSPDVTRVIFIASPHGGSLRSSGLVGQGASLLVEPSPQQTAIHEQLMRDNPHTFNPLIERRFPTSIDMLASQSPLLQAMRQMRLSACVKLHNIIGVSHPVSLDGPSDGVVSVRSASHPGCESVLAVNSAHAKVHRALQTSAEILRILDCHWRD